MSLKSESLAKDERELSGWMVLTQSGDSEACGRLLRKVEQLVRGYLHNSLRKVGIAPEGRAEDILQEVLLAVYAKRATFDPDQCFLPWMYAIARYKLVDNLRTTKGNRRTVSLDDAPPPIAPESDASAALDVDHLLSLLPHKQKMVLGLVKLEGLSVSEASEKTGLSESDVKVSVHRAIQRIRKKLKGGSRDDG